MDERDHDFNRRRVWGDEPLQLAQITGDETYTVLLAVTERFGVHEQKATDSDRARFAFRLLDPDRFNILDLQQADLLLFAGRRFERQSLEWKRQEPAHYLIYAIPIGDI